MRHLAQLHDRRLACPGYALEVTMRAVALAAILSLAAFSASAQTATTCKAQADEKKLAGAALKSFTTKCERDAKAACDASAKEKKLAGAAKASFKKKCKSAAPGRCPAGRLAMKCSQQQGKHQAGIGIGQERISRSVP